MNQAPADRSNHRRVCWLDDVILTLHAAQNLMLRLPREHVERLGDAFPDALKDALFQALALRAVATIGVRDEIGPKWTEPDLWRFDRAAFDHNPLGRSPPSENGSR